MIKYRLTEKGIKKSKSIFKSIGLLMPEEDILRYLGGFRTQGKTREHLKERFKYARKGVISKAIKELKKRGYIERVDVVERDTPAISKRSPELTRKAPRITPKVGRLR